MSIKHNGELRRYVIVSLTFGGLNICVQVIACLVMLAATVKMKHLSKKNGFEGRKFSDIELNLTVSVLIAVGYTLDYVTEVTCTILVLRDNITLEQQ